MTHTDLFKQLGISQKPYDNIELPKVIFAIKGDMNDADYNTKITEIELHSREAIADAKTLLQNIKTNMNMIKSYNLQDEYEEYYPLVLQEMTEYCMIPSDEYGEYCHTIESIEAALKFNGILYPIDL